MLTKVTRNLITRLIMDTNGGSSSSQGCVDTRYFKNRANDRINIYSSVERIYTNLTYVQENTTFTEQVMRMEVTI